MEEAMPLTAKGNEILANMKKEYGAEKGENVFYASKKAGTITGTDAEAQDRSSAGHKAEAEKLGKMLEDERDPAKRKELQEKIKFHEGEVTVVGDVAADATLMDAVARIRGDMASHKNALDSLTGTLYTVSSRLKRLEK
jgi:hypothetical protein